MNIRFSKNVIERSTRYDFSDDGNRFRGYIYKNILSISYLRVGDDLYVTIRMDYLLSYKEYRLANLFAYTNEFNGVNVNKFRADKFLENCEICYKYIMEYNSPEKQIERYRKQIEEAEATIARCENEISSSRNLIETIKNNIAKIEASASVLS